MLRLRLINGHGSIMLEIFPINTASDVFGYSYVLSIPNLKLETEGTDVRNSPLFLRDLCITG